MNKIMDYLSKYFSNGFNSCYPVLRAIPPETLEYALVSANQGIMVDVKHELDTFDWRKI